MKETINQLKILIIDTPSNIASDLSCLVNDSINNKFGVLDILDPIVDCCHYEELFTDHLDCYLDELYINNCGDIQNSYTEETIAKNISRVHRVGINISIMIRDLGLYNNGVFPYLVHPNTTVKTLVFIKLPF